MISYYQGLAAGMISINYLTHSSLLSPVSSDSPSLDINGLATALLPNSSHLPSWTEVSNFDLPFDQINDVRMYISCQKSTLIVSNLKRNNCFVGHCYHFILYINRNPSIILGTALRNRIFSQEYYVCFE